MIRPFTVFIMLLPHMTAARQTPMENYFFQLRQNKLSTIPQEVYKPGNAKATLTALSSYYKDTLSTIRSKAYSITRIIAVKSNQPSIRQQGLQQLVNACRDKDSGITGSVLTYLTEFKKA